MTGWDAEDLHEAIYERELPRALSALRHLCELTGTQSTEHALVMVDVCGDWGGEFAATIMGEERLTKGPLVSMGDMRTFSAPLPLDSFTILMAEYAPALLPALSCRPPNSVAVLVVDSADDAVLRFEATPHLS